jgi:3'-phosphoadenosine 5'-phosphosulfate sulfotransferase (PAPS reductase)/FAD synthetase
MNPTMNRRWCCYHLKLKPIHEFVRDLNPQRAEITGLRRDESFRRMLLPG